MNRDSAGKAHFPQGEDNGEFQLYVGLIIIILCVET